MGHMGWWRPFGLEAELEMADDLIDGCGTFAKSSEDWECLIKEVGKQGIG